MTHIIRCSAAFVLLWGSLAAAAPEVWILQGHPGDYDHEVIFGLRTGLLTYALKERYGIPEESLHLAANDELTRERLATEVMDMDRASREADAVWVFIFGHANPTGKGANFNLHGPDVNNRELGQMLRHVRGPAPLIVVFTTACSGRFLPALAGPGRVVITATLPSGETNETRFPQALVDTMRDPDTDADSDGRVSVLELFRAARAEVEAFYRWEELMQTEHALLDADGDGRGTQEPSGAEADAASRYGLELKGLYE